MTSFLAPPMSATGAAWKTGRITTARTMGDNSSRSNSPQVITVPKENFQELVHLQTTAKGGKQGNKVMLEGARTIIKQIKKEIDMGTMMQEKESKYTSRGISIVKKP